MDNSSETTRIDTLRESLNHPDHDIHEVHGSEAPGGHNDQAGSDSRQLQQAIEQIVDYETAALPHLEQLSEAVAKETELPPARKRPSEDSPVHDWFFTFMCMNIPIVGWIYLIWLAFNKKQTERRNFARAYLFYKLVFLLISIVLLGIVLYIGLDMVDRLLAYMEML